MKGMAQVPCGGCCLKFMAIKGWFLDVCNRRFTIQQWGLSGMEPCQPRLYCAAWAVQGWNIFDLAQSST